MRKIKLLYGKVGENMIYILVLSIISFLVIFYMALFKAAAKEDEVLEEIYKDDIE